MKNELPSCTIEKKMDFTVCGEIKSISSNHGIEHFYVEFKESGILATDEKHVIKTFSDATLIDEISRRYDVDLVINKIKE